MNVTVDRAGRIVLPKSIRQELDITPGTTLELEKAGECLTLRPVRGNAPLTQEQGVWVFRTGEALSASDTDEVLEKIRASLP